MRYDSRISLMVYLSGWEVVYSLMEVSTFCFTLWSAKDRSTVPAATREESGRDDVIPGSFSMNDFAVSMRVVSPPLMCVVK